MGLFKYFKRKKGEKEYLRRLYEKSGVGSSSSHSKGEGKYPSKPIYREVVFKPSDKECPKCHSHLIRPAGYGDRLECQNCGHIFS